MAQHDMVIDNGPGLAVRTDINAALQAIITQNSGPVEPTVKYPGMLWLDTTVTPDGLLRQRNQANTAWITPQTGSAGTPISNIVRTAVTTSGTYTKPASLKFLEVAVLAGGGGGGGARGTSAGQYTMGGGGGGGAYAVKLFTAAALPASVSMTVGAGGAGGIGASGTPGGTGGTTSFGSLLSVSGGNGGVDQAAGAPALWGPAGAAGTSITGTPDFYKCGENGTPAWIEGSTAQWIHVGNGGSCFLGLGGCIALTAIGSGADGVPGFGPGAGGSGSVNAPSAGARNGAAGNAGIISLKEYF